MEEKKLIRNVLNKLKNKIITNELYKLSKDELMVQNFIRSLEYVNETIEDQKDETRKLIIEGLQLFIKATETEPAINRNGVRLIDRMNYFINILPDNKKLTLLKNEFSERYDALIKMLKDNLNESNLTLFTKEGREFKLFKRNDTLMIRPESDNNTLSTSKENLIKIAYGEKDNNLKAYIPIIIEKIFDNSILNEIRNDNNDFKENLVYSTTEGSKIKKLEDDKDRLYGEIKQLEDKLNEKEELFNSVKSMYENSKSLVDEYNNAKETVLSDLKIHTSTEFWEKQIKFYSKRYWVYIGVVIVSILVLLGSIFIIDKQFIIDIDNKEKTEQKNINTNQLKTNQNVIKNIDSFSPNFIKYGFMILLISLAIWIIRIFMKIALSNYHLSIDAKERVTMIETYLALMKDGSTLDNNDKRIMIESIFRQTNHGIVRDENSVTVTDIISSFKRK